MNIRTFKDLNEIYKADKLKAKLNLSDDTPVKFSTECCEFMLIIDGYKYVVKDYDNSLFLFFDCTRAMSLWKRIPPEPKEVDLQEEESKEMKVMNN